MEEGYFDELYEVFSKVLYIPVWKIAKYYGVSGDDILQLQRLGIITEVPIEKEFYNKNDREYFTANLYNIKIFEHTKEEIQSALNIANSGDSYNIRIETDTKEEIEPLINKIAQIFKIGNYRVYDRRDGGFNTYLSIKVLNNSELEKNVLMEEIQALKKELKDQEITLEKAHKREISIMQRKINNRDKKIEELKNNKKSFFGFENYLQLKEYVEFQKFSNGISNVFLTIKEIENFEETFKKDQEEYRNEKKEFFESLTLLTPLANDEEFELIKKFVDVIINRSFNAINNNEKPVQEYSMEESSNSLKQILRKLYDEMKDIHK